MIAAPTLWRLSRGNRFPFFRIMLRVVGEGGIGVHNFYLGLIFIGVAVLAFVSMIGLQKVVG